MPELSPSRKRFIRERSLVILLVGLACALAIYVTAMPDAEDPLVYSGPSKKYLLEMEKFGGKANILATEVREWFQSIWHGQSLAFTIMALSALLAWAYRFIAVRHQPRTQMVGDPPSGARGR